MIKKETTPKGGNVFALSILPNLVPPCKVQPQTREVRMTSQLRLRVLSVLRQLNMPCVVGLAELSRLVNEPEGRTQGALYSLKRIGLVDYEFLTGLGYIVRDVVQPEGCRAECPYGFSDCRLCMFVSAACQGNNEGGRT